MFHVVSSTGEALATFACVVDAKRAETSMPRAHHVERDDGVHMTEPPRAISPRSNAPSMTPPSLNWGSW